MLASPKEILHLMVLEGILVPVLPAIGVLSAHSHVGSLSSARTALRVLSARLLGYMLILDRRGSALLAVAAWPSFQRLHRFKNWFFSTSGVILLGTIGNAVYDVLKHWQQK